jgi:hypothetical protein
MTRKVKNKTKEGTDKEKEEEFKESRRMTQMKENGRGRSEVGR